MRCIFIVTICLTMFAQATLAQRSAAFTVVPLGVKGGSDESNLSAYMIAAAGSSNYICADAGTLTAGLEKAVTKGIFHGSTQHILRHNIKGYLISHGHLDHLAGMILNSPDDTAKNIYAMPYVTDVLKNNYFTWQSWANFTNEGDKPALGKYTYIPLEENKEIELIGTSLGMQAFELSHSNPYKSTAFLLNNNGQYLLYLGDTGADENEHSQQLHKLWQHIAPLVKSGALKAIFIEVSFPDAQPVKQLFGHLSPKWLMQEMHVLAKLASKTTLQKVSIVVTHIKPNGNNEKIITQELQFENDLGLRLVYPRQAQVLHF